ncbi:hypothetical protein K435DRAFT_848003 [Dendrothele bispora CBS 962.96]|uniref:Mediator of RNA polymerase II transcription subunit 7 n=1 Tax=Dendrothele bispora (strain CBS 962.96) TaxID=1314807 RepID=A0A4V4HIQ5_DENBC|nr:hypothetical protein K435DRAFT_848003 [Dendrothele bispora CBS 962.96]
MDEDAELRNPFPSPPSHYTKYTTHNIHLLSLLKERAPQDVDIALVNQSELLSDQKDVPDWPLTQLEKPRVDWILEEPEPYYDVFGDRWFVKDRIPSLEEAGSLQLYPSEPHIDRRPHLQSILRSMLVTYSHLTSSLLAPPPTTSSHHDTQPEWQQHVEWITILGQNLMAAANELRPARSNLETMMKKQLQFRREETAAVHSKCDALEAKLQEIRASVDVMINEKQSISTRESKTVNHQPQPETSSSQAMLTEEDMLRWAEEIR